MEDLPQEPQTRADCERQTGMALVSFHLQCFPLNLQIRVTITSRGTNWYCPSTGRSLLVSMLSLFPQIDPSFMFETKIRSVLL